MLLFLVRSWKWILAAALAILAYLYFVTWSPENQIATKQRALLEAVLAPDLSELDALLSPQYSDRWEFDREEVMQAVRDVARQFLHLEGELTDAGVTIDEPAGSAEVSGKIKLRGKGNPLGQEIIARVNRLDGRFTFIWAKESWAPWSWKLQTINHPDLYVPPGYTPGMLEEMIGF